MKTPQSTGENLDEKMDEAKSEQPIPLAKLESLLKYTTAISDGKPS